MSFDDHPLRSEPIQIGGKLDKPRIDLWSAGACGAAHRGIKNLQGVDVHTMFKTPEGDLRRVGFKISKRGMLDEWQPVMLPCTGRVVHRRKPQKPF